jgi:DNA-binding winged helix-turn-helix (wHTH) protein
VILFPPFHLDPINEQLWRGTRRVALKPKTFAVLRYLLERPQRLITKEDLLDALWAEVHVGEAVLKTHIREIRQALGDTAKAPHFIETVHRRGYRFIAPVQDAPPSPHGPLPRPRSSPTSSFVGRHAELACLRGSLERARGGQRHVAFVTGEPGIGKTTLVKEFLEPLQGRGDLWVTWGDSASSSSAPVKPICPSWRPWAGCVGLPALSVSARS